MFDALKTEASSLGKALDAPLDMAIIGSGFSGLGMAVNMDKAGKRDWLIFELADEVGGTWRDNRYPGCACDVPSRLYSFSFERNPNWTHVYSRQPEILAYLKNTAKKYGLTDRIRFRHRVTDLTWLDDTSLWQITTQSGDAFFARDVTVAAGPLRIPAKPDFKGMETFKGTLVHTAEWPADLDLKGKRVAVIGTGASAIQTVPGIIDDVKSLTLFQRTAPWIIPRNDKVYSGTKRWLLSHVPFFDQLLRGWRYSVHELLGMGFFRNPKLAKSVEKQGLAHLEAQIPHKAMQQTLKPSFRLGCKRILVSDDYYPALARDHARVIPSGLSHFEGNTLVATDGSTADVDVVIFATGFDATAPLKDVTIRGKGGELLEDRWTKRMQAYMGTMVSGFPNLFVLMGPNTGTGHTSVVYMAESQMAFVMKAVQHRNSLGAKIIDVRRESEDAFVSDIAGRMKRTIWLTGCESWYLDDQGHNPTIWPDFTFLFRRMCNALRKADFTTS